MIYKVVQMEILDDKIQTIRERIKERIQNESRVESITTVGWLYDFYEIGIVSMEDIKEWKKETLKKQQI